MKKCFVPCCLNTDSSAPKKRLFTVPKNKSFRKRWFDAVNRSVVAATKYCCEDHFTLKNDCKDFFKITLYYKNTNLNPQLKRKVVPHRFLSSPNPRVDTTQMESSDSESDTDGVDDEEFEFQIHNDTLKDPPAEKGLEDNELPCFTAQLENDAANWIQYKMFPSPIRWKEGVVPTIKSKKATELSQLTPHDKILKEENLKKIEYIRRQAATVDVNISKNKIAKPLMWKENVLTPPRTWQNIPEIPLETVGLEQTATAKLETIIKTKIPDEPNSENIHSSNIESVAIKTEELFTEEEYVIICGPSLQIMPATVDAASLTQTTKTEELSEDECNIKPEPILDAVTDERMPDKSAPKVVKCIPRTFIHDDLSKKIYGSGNHRVNPELIPNLRIVPHPRKRKKSTNLERISASDSTHTSTMVEPFSTSKKVDETEALKTEVVRLNNVLERKNRIIELKDRQIKILKEVQRRNVRKIDRMVAYVNDNKRVFDGKKGSDS